MTPTRSDDERVLRILAMYMAGKSQAAVAAAMHTTKNHIARTIRSVRDQDCKHDPKARTYWRTRE